jgi:hypothetical protein
MTKPRSILDHIGEMLDEWIEERFPVKFDATLSNIEDTVVDVHRIAGNIENGMGSLQGNVDTIGTNITKIWDKIELLNSESTRRHDEVQRGQKECAMLP